MSCFHCGDDHKDEDHAYLRPSVRKHGTKQSELNEIARDDGTPQRNSGRGKHDKGDATLDNAFLVDYKEYPKGFTVDLKAWAKICTDAIRAGNFIPCLKIILGEGNQKVRLFVISEDEMNEYRRLRREELDRELASYDYR